MSDFLNIIFIISAILGIITSVASFATTITFFQKIFGLIIGFFQRFFNKHQKVEVKFIAPFKLKPFMFLTIMFLLSLFLLLSSLDTMNYKRNLASWSTKIDKLQLEIDHIKLQNSLIIQTKVDSLINKTSIK